MQGNNDRGRGGREADLDVETADQALVEEPGRWPGKSSLTQYLPVHRWATGKPNNVSTSLIDEARRGSSQPLDPELRGRLEKSLGADLADVRVHSHSAAASAAKDLNAHAFTVGNEVFLGSGLGSGKRYEQVLAHEVAHTVQQRGAALPGKSEGIDVSEPHDSHEHEAHAFADAFAAGQQARVTPGGAGISRAVINRLAAGALDVLEYTPDVWRMDATDYARAGCIMALKFTPGPSVDAKTIGFIQTVIGSKKGKKRAVADNSPDEKKTLEGRQIPTKEDPGGAAIDREANKKNPMYGVNNDGTANSAGGGGGGKRDNKLGHRFMSESGAIDEAPAQMVDWPKFMDVGPDSFMKFETAVVGLGGADQGKYYGTIRWGWEIDGSGSFSLVKQEMKDGDPSPQFQRAAQIWNESQTVDGAKNLQIPIPMEREAARLTTPQLIDRYNTTSDPIAKAVFRTVLLKRTMTVRVETKKTDYDVYVKVKGVKEIKTYVVDNLKKASHTFLIRFGDFMGDSNVGNLHVKVMDEDVTYDDTLYETDWDPLSALHGGNDDVFVDITCGA